MIFLRQATILALLALTPLITHTIPMPSRFGVDFHSSMEITNQYKKDQAQRNSAWQKVMSLYNQFIINDLQIPEKPRIPLVVHQIWLGSTLPEKCRILQKTWFIHQPDWLYLLWTDTMPQTFAENITVITPHSFEDVTKFLNEHKRGIYIIDITQLPFSMRGHFNARTNFGEKSDILRYEILYHCGGLYVDTDFECLQPLDVFNYACDFYAGSDYKSSYFLVHNSLIAARAQHPIITACKDGIRAQPERQSVTTDNAIMMRTGPMQLTKHVLKHIQACQDRTVIFPVTYFHPWPNFFMKQNTRTQIEQWIKPESCGIHHWHVSWMN